MGRGSESAWLVKRALDCARIAVQFDQACNVDQAVLYYEKTIAYIDHVMPRLSAETDTRTRLMVHRRGYDVRLSQLRPFASSAHKAAERRKSGVPLEDIVAAVTTRDYEYPPPHAVLRPYWLLRVLRQTLTEGGHLTQVVYVPKGVWTQPGAMFNGLHSKVQAFHSVACAMEGLASLDRSGVGDVQHLQRVLEEFMHVRDELVVVQNDLSKPFTFIHEVQPRQQEVVVTKTKLGMVNAFVNTVGKNVKKYAEVGYQRTKATLPGRASDDDLQQYATLLMELCTRVQILDEWYGAVQQEKDRRKSQARSGDSGGGNNAENTQALQLLDEISSEHAHIAVFMQECICELVLRDLEQLIVRWVRKMRKNFARMYWTEDQPDG